MAAPVRQRRRRQGCCQGRPNRQQQLAAASQKPNRQTRAKTHWSRRAWGMGVQGCAWVCIGWVSRLASAANGNPCARCAVPPASRSQRTIKSLITPAPSSSAATSLCGRNSSHRHGRNDGHGARFLMYTSTGQGNHEPRSCRACVWLVAVAAPSFVYPPMRSLRDAGSACERTLQTPSIIHIAR